MNNNYVANILRNRKVNRFDVRNRFNSNSTVYIIEVHDDIIKPFGYHLKEMIKNIDLENYKASKLFLDIDRRIFMIIDDDTKFDSVDKQLKLISDALEEVSNEG